MQHWENLMKMGSEVSEAHFNTMIMSSLLESYRLTLQMITVVEQASTLMGDTGFYTKKMKPNNLIPFLMDGTPCPEHLP